ncbi:MAG TPA: hypothetical protein VI685_13750 [Candidatus Angelobacter sp.]
MKTGWTLTREAFDNLLRWLSSDREEAGRKYEDIRSRLIKLFNCRGCATPEELADDTINRVIKIIQEKAPEYSGDPILLFFGVAKNVFHEWTRTKPLNPDDFPAPEPNCKDEDLECLEDCLGELDKRERSIITRYYEQEGRKKDQSQADDCC